MLAESIRDTACGSDRSNRALRDRLAIDTRELRESADRYRAIVDTAVDAIIVTDAAGTIRDFNGAAECIFGYGADEAIGRSITILMPASTRMADEQHFRTYVPTGACRTISRNGPVTGCRKDGSQVPLDISISEWISGNGERCFTGILRDVTARRRAEDEQRQAKEKAEAAACVEAELRRKIEEKNKELKTANEGLQKFTSIVAHDLRAPMRRIEAFIRLIREDYAAGFDEDGADILFRIERGANRMQLMLDSLLDYSKCNSSAIRGKHANLRQVVNDALTSFDFDALGVQLRIDLTDISSIKGDPVLLSHVMQNLIGNAIKFRRGPAPSIAIHATRRGDAIELSITDNGIGIEPEFAERVFDMFYRLHDEEEYEGTGIGLTICRKIIGDHGGKIWVDPDYHDGARLALTLPAA